MDKGIENREPSTNKGSFGISPVESQGKLAQALHDMSFSGSKPQAKCLVCEGTGIWHKVEGQSIYSDVCRGCDGEGWIDL